MVSASIKLGGRLGRPKAMADPFCRAAARKGPASAQTLRRGKLPALPSSHPD